jgi:hypothetical protein
MVTDIRRSAASTMCRRHGSESYRTEPIARSNHQRRKSMTIAENPVRNGVDTATLFATIDAVKGDPDIAKFRFRATNTWMSGPTTVRPSTASTAPSRR